MPAGEGDPHTTAAASPGSYGSQEGPVDDGPLSVFDAPPPAVETNMWATAVGQRVQRMWALFGAVVLLLTAIAVVEYSTGGGLQYQLDAAGLLAGGVLVGMLGWVVHHSPYDAIAALNDGVAAMHAVGRNLGATLAQSQAQVKNLSAENDRLERAVSGLEATAQGVCDELAEAHIVRKGMQSTLNTLLTDLGSRHSELATVARGLQAEIDSLGEVSDEAANRFLAAATGLDKQTARAEKLAGQLEETAAANTKLVRNMLELTDKMEHTIGELHDADFMEHVHALILKTDALADAGLRDKLRKDVTLESSERLSLHGLLVDIDTLLKEQYLPAQAKKAEVLAKPQALITKYRAVE